MSKKSDRFPLRVSRGIATSDEYAELTDRERSVFWTAAALSFEPLTFKRLARTMNSKIVDAVGRLVEQGFLEVDGEEIMLAARWAKVDMSTERVKDFREREKAAKASAPVAAPTPQAAAVAVPQAPQIASQPVPAPQAQPAPVQIKESRIPTFPPAENFEDAMPYTDDWDDSDFGIDLGGLAASSAFELDPIATDSAASAPAAIERSPQPVLPSAPAPTVTKAARKRALAASQSSEVESIALPGYLPREVWLAFVEHRRFIKAPLNLTAAKLILAEAAKLHEDRHNVVQAFNKTIASGRWLSINAPNGPNDKSSAQQAERRRTGGVAL